jgi:hypothetical protein
MSQTLVLGQRDVLIQAALPAQLVFFGMGALIYRYREQALRIGTTPLLLCMFACFAMLDYYAEYVTRPQFRLAWDSWHSSF